MLQEFLDIRNSNRLSIEEWEAIYPSAFFTYRAKNETFLIEGIVRIDLEHRLGEGRYIHSLWSDPNDPEFELRQDMVSKRVYGIEAIGVFIKTTKEWRLGSGGLYTTGRHKVGIEAPEGVKIIREGAQPKISS